jgi:late competence protein required for DNA uptake (superfamily II DNA/RNA helicase)
MAENLSLLDINTLLRQNAITKENSFSVIKSIASNLNQKSEVYLQEVILRVIEQRDVFENYQPVINDFARAIGLFPYLNPETLNLADRIAYEFHRPVGVDQDNIVFHRAQARIYFELLEGKNVILSAPTSFGKSLVIDTVIATQKYKNIVIVLPTIALIDETRKRLSKFREQYKIITHSSQVITEKNIFVLTQERVMEIIKDVDIDFFVIDEFYKIQTTAQDQDRSVVLNQAFYKLLKKGGQFYLLGPNIENINNEVFPSSVDYIFIKTDYKTVVTEKVKVNISEGEEAALLNLCSSLDEPTLIYCASPKSANRVAKLLFASGKFEKSEVNSEAVKWLKQEYHPLWYLPTALEYGIGIHHGKIPRAISQFSVKAFNESKLQFLVCTSTLIEGVNTRAKNVIIYDNKIARDKFDFFTFNNICGRSGRMFQHFIGRVYLFHEPPTEELPLVDFPLFSQKADVSEKLLMQMDNEDLSAHSKDRMKSLAQNGVLNINTIKANSNIDPQSQINLAKEIREKYRQYYSSLSWKSFPDARQVYFVCDLIFRHLIGKPTANVLSGRQLGYRVNSVKNLKTIRALIDEEIKGKVEPEEINEAIENILDFVRGWAQYNFPKYLMAVNRIQSDIFKERNLEPGDFSYFATQIECLFTDPLFTALDEYGIPIQTSNKIRGILKTGGNLDDLLLQIKELQVANLDVMPFEKELLNDVKTQV